MTLPPNLNIYISVALFVLGAYLFALYVGLIVWTVRDVRSRTRDALGQILATFLVAVFTLPGLLIYMLLRPHTTLAEEYERNLAEEAILQDLEDRRICPGCHRRVEADFVVCPDCHFQLRYRCTGCARLLNPHWDVCPYCGLTRAKDEDPKKGRGQEHAAPRAQTLTVPVHGPEAVAPLAAQDGPRVGGWHDAVAVEERTSIPRTEDGQGAPAPDEAAAGVTTPWALEEETESAEELPVEEPPAEQPAIIVEDTRPADQSLAAESADEAAGEEHEAATPVDQV